MPQSPTLPMRVLLLHNRYRAEGGEERSVAEIASLLERRGHAVGLIERFSGGLGRVRAGRAMLHGGEDATAVADAIRAHRAEVVHAHNLHPLFGWRSLAVARAAGARTVLHLHNFRLFCAIGVAYRDGSPCFRCRERHTLPGLRLRCRGSLAEAAVYAASLRSQQPRLFEHVDQFVAVSEATAVRLAELGLPAERVAALPNFCADDRLAASSTADAGRYALAVGRLVEEKGFELAIEAAEAVGVPLVIVGDGPEESRLRRAASRGEVRFCGRIPAAELDRIRSDAAVLLAPSRWEEPCPYAVLDAMGAGVPVLASERGGLPGLVGAEATVRADTVEAWASALGELWRDPELRRRRGDAALERAREHFGEERFYERLVALYTAG